MEADVVAAGGGGNTRCYFCGISTIRGPRRRSLPPIRSFQLTEEYLTTHPFIIEYSEELFENRQIAEEDRICRPCFQRAQRFSIRQHEAQVQEEAAAEVHRSVIDEVFEPPASVSDPVVEQPIDPLMEEPEEPADAIPEEVAPEQENAQDGIFSVPEYSRVPYSLTRCLVRGCQQHDLCTIPLTMRRSVLSQQKIYIFPDSRVCNVHMNSNIWHDFAQFCRPLIDTFNDIQMSNMLTLLSVTEQVIQAQGVVQQENAQEIITSIPDFSRVPHSPIRCLVRGCQQQDLHRIPLLMRRSILAQQNIYISPGSRVCNEHMYSDIWHDFATFCRPLINTFNRTQLSNVFRLLQETNVRFLDFERLDLIEDRFFHFYIGFSKENFLNILEQTPSIKRNFKRKPHTALATVLSKLHTGDSNERLSTLFRMSPQYFSRVMKKVRKCLIREFVSKNLGFEHIYSAENAQTYRQDLFTRITRIPNVLYGGSDPNDMRLITICDGTYFYVQKSSNYKYQRKTFSTHKCRNLLKVFLIVCPDGYIIEAIGPYPANKSDAEIMEELIKEDEDNPFHWFFEKEDVFILDRGFRDVMTKMFLAGYNAFIPHTRHDFERQLTTEQANDTRKVTLCRWVVETINGRLKNQFRQLRNQYANIAAPHLFQTVKIGCALINAYGVKLTNNALADEIINEIYLKHDAPNQLSDLIVENNFNMRSANFYPIDASIDGFEQFPELTYNELIVMALGPYQVQQARSYYGEHVKEDGAFTIEVYGDRNVHSYLSRYEILATDAWLLRAKIQSRHQSSRLYFVYVLLDNVLQGRNKIIGYYCNCLSGKRTLGCCSHVMCIVWYMAWARHQEDLPEPPAGFLDHLFSDEEVE